jgi:hypothetical protein
MKGVYAPEAHTSSLRKHSSTGTAKHLLPLFIITNCIFVFFPCLATLNKLELLGPQPIAIFLSLHRGELHHPLHHHI